MTQPEARVYPGRLIMYVLAAKDLDAQHQGMVGQIRGGRILTAYQQTDKQNQVPGAFVGTPVASIIVFRNPADDGPSQSPYGGNTAIDYIENAPYSDATPNPNSPNPVGGSWFNQVDP